MVWLKAILAPISVDGQTEMSGGSGVIGLLRGLLSYDFEAPGFALPATVRQGPLTERASEPFDFAQGGRERHR